MRWIMPEVSVARHPSIQFYTARTLTQLGDVYSVYCAGVYNGREHCDMLLVAGACVYKILEYATANNAYVLHVVALRT